MYFTTPLENNNIIKIVTIVNADYVIRNAYNQLYSKQIYC